MLTRSDRRTLEGLAVQCPDAAEAVAAVLAELDEAVADRGRAVTCRYEAFPDRLDPETWRVEAVNHASEGECYVTAFYGLDCERRAKEYAAWMIRRGAKTGGK